MNQVLKPEVRALLRSKMKLIVLISLTVLLSACGASQSESANVEFNVTAITTVAWGEQVQVNHSALVGTPVTMSYKITGGTWQSLTPEYKAGNKVVFILPEVPELPELPNFSSPYTITSSQYDLPLTSSQINQYSDRGTVRVKIVAGSKTINRYYKPYGAVEPGELNVMTQGNCNDLASNVNSLGYTVVDGASSGGLCYVTAGFNTSGTSQAITHLNNNLSNTWVDKNVVQHLDPRNFGGFDPSCDQIAGWLDRAGGSGFDMLLPADLLSSSNAAVAHNSGVTGNGVNVFVIGGGIDANDDFECLDAAGDVLFEDHDTHIAEIVSLIAPDATIEDRIVCSATGNCPTSEVVKALLDVSTTAQSNTGKDIINMSLGGPLANSVLERTLQHIEPGITVITSNGNGPNAPAHYPASYSSGNPTAGSLDNVVAIAASGFKAGNWHMVGFNTRNAQMFAPGTNVCLQTATGFRCDPSANSQPDNLGITGTSFAAPIATGMAALYLESSSSNLNPQDLRQCLLDGSLNNPNMNRMIWFDSAVCP